MSKRKSHDEVVSQIFSIVGNEYTVLSRYTKASNPIKIRHNTCGFVYETRTSNFIYQGCRCPKCAGKLQYTNQSFKEKVFSIFGNEYTVLGNYKNTKTKIKIRHNVCGFVIDILPLNFLRRRSCPYCSGKFLDQKMFSKIISQMEDTKEYVFLEKYKGTNTKINVKHIKCGHVYKVSPHHFMAGRRCPFCKESHGEHEIEMWLSNRNVNHICQKKFENCRFKKELPFDFYLPDSNVCIEYDGEQHFKKVDLFGGEQGLAIRRLRDNIKDEFCKKEGIKLLRIKYNENIKDILSKFIEA